MARIRSDQRLGGSKVGLPGYAWDAGLRNYVNLATQRMVKRSEIVNLLDGTTRQAGETMGRLARAAQNGTITPAQFYEAMQREVKLAYNAAAALGKGGWAQMSKSDWGKNGRLLREEYGRIRSFAQDMADGKVSEAQAVARAKLYADSAYKRYWANYDEQMVDAGKNEERWRTRGDERVCPICRGLEGQHWQPLGTLPLPGDPHAGCRCEKEYR